MMRVGPSKHIWDSRYKTDSELIEELWDESIDFTLALQAIHKADNLGEVQAIAVNVLLKHGKRATAE